MTQTTPGRLQQDQRFAGGVLLGTTIADRYVVERELGRGGMAIVYLARDLRHDRQVAVKVLEAHVAPDGAERFLREIHIAARLTHPHVLGVHDSGEFDGRLFYVMPYVAGETLRSRLTRDGALPIGEAVRLTRELADALAHAHDAGVVHRDLKPENVLLSGGHAVVADFGIAKAIAAVAGGANAAAGSAPSDPLTRTGMSLGTPAYMAPEQVVADASVDYRADLYALGLTSYEMVAGAHPFAGRSPQAIAAAHLTETPRPVIERRSDTPPALSALVSQLLAKDPAARPQSAEAVRRVLDDLGAAPVPSQRSSRRTQLVTVAAAVTLLIAAGYALRTRIERGPDVSASVHTVAVLPFGNVGGNANDEYFSDGLTDELADALSRIPGLRLPGRTSTYAFKGKTVAAQEIGRALEVTAYIGGSVRRAGDRLRVATQLVSTIDGKVLWDSVFETRSGDVFAVQDSLTRAVVASLAPRLGLRDSRADSRGTAVADVKRGTANEAAYELYLKGVYYWHERGAANVKRSIDLFQQAIARDPTFARAYAQLAFAYTTLEVYDPEPTDSVAPLISAAALRAITLDSTLSEAQHAAGASLRREFRFAEAEVHFRSALRIDPSNQFAHHAFGTVLLELGRTDEAIAELRTATRLDPLAKSAGTALAEAYVDARRFGDAETEARRVLAIDSTFVLALSSLGFAETFAGHADSAVRILEAGARRYPESFLIGERLLFAYAAAGRWDDVDRIRAQLRQPGGDRTGGLTSAFADLVLGDREPLIRLVGTREGLRRWITLLRGGGCNPLAGPLWSDARYRVAMRGIGIAPCALARPWPIQTRQQLR